MNTQGQHLLMDLWLKKDTDLESIVKKIKDYVNENFSVVKRTNHKFTPQGETIVFILSESHFTLHTYPEHNYLSLDIYICSMDKDMIKVEQDLMNICLPLKSNSSRFIRGDKGGIRPLC